MIKPIQAPLLMNPPWLIKPPFIADKTLWFAASNMEVS